MNTADIHGQPARNNSFSDKQQHIQRRLVGIVVYDYLAHNNKELTIRAGEKVFVSSKSTILQWIGFFVPKKSIHCNIIDISRLD